MLVSEGLTAHAPERPAQRNSVTAVCGLGAVTGYGWGRQILWDGLLSGKSACVPSVGHQDLLGHDVAWLGRIPEPDEPSRQSRFARAIDFSVAEAISDAQTRGWKPGRVVGLIHAIVLGEVDRWQGFYMDRDARVSKREYVELMPSTVLSAQMRQHGFNGPCMAVMAMCASGNAAMLTAKMWMDAGICDDVIVVASDVSGTDENLRHFVDLGVLFVDAPSLDVCRPFQTGSKGFSLGEASVAFVMSRQQDPGYFAVLGGAMTHDGFHATSINPSHEQIRRCFTDALANAQIDAEDVVYLNAHGPGTAQCDAAEREMLDTLLMEAEGVFSVKPLAGHCQAAASAVELAAATLAYHGNIIPASPHVSDAHPLLLDGATPRTPGIMLKSSIGMGGHNSVLVLDDL